MTARQDLMWLVVGHRTTAAITTAVELGIIDALGGGARTPGDVAAAVGTDPDATGRLLRFLSTIGVVDEVDHEYALSELGAPLASHAPASLAPQALLQADPAIWAAWGNLAHSIRTGENAFSALHGMDVWEHRAAHPERSRSFDELMTSLTSVVAAAVAATYDFRPGTHVLDVGGGQGALMAAVLRAHPTVTGTVFDQPHVVAESAPDDVADRWSAVGGSFFEPVPEADYVLMKSIIHDWPDEESVAILRRCAAALRPGGAVLLVEIVLDRPGHERVAAYSDLNMLVGPGGRERTEAEYASLFAQSGLRLTRVLDTGTPHAIVEAVAAGS
jgi:2-polyprenyl-3-methyl-5-hydroxy-6-metoxy-1,4-benzoquinol methylase